MVWKVSRLALERHPLPEGTSWFFQRSLIRSQGGMNRLQPFYVRIDELRILDGDGCPTHVDAQIINYELLPWSSSPRTIFLCPVPCGRRVVTSSPLPG